MVDLSYIREPVDTKVLKQELSRRHFLRTTNKGGKEIYVTSAHTSPNVMQEIGRLRELAFATEGGGTGQAADIDEFDTLPDPYCFKQLVVWDPVEEQIVGGYRFIHGSNMYRDASGMFYTPMARLFRYSDEFIEKVLPYTVELARAFVQPAYQPTTNLRKGIYSLDNLWDGLGALAIEIPVTLFYMGKVTTYSNMDPRIKSLLTYYLRKYFPDPNGWVTPREPLAYNMDLNAMDAFFTGGNYKADFQLLQREAREVHASIPPLFNAYINLSSSLRYFGICHHEDFGSTDEAGIIIPINDIYSDKKNRYFESYGTTNHELDRRKLFRIRISRLPWWRNNRHEDPAERQQRLELKRLKKFRMRSLGLTREQRRQQRKDRRQQRANAQPPAADRTPQSNAEGTPPNSSHSPKDTLS